MFVEILNKILLNESVSGDNVVDAIKTHRCALINYNSTKGMGEHTGERFIVPFAYGVTKAGNPVLRAFQPYGDSTSQVPRWKYFRLDRIENWKTTDKEYTKEEIDNYCGYGDANYNGDESMASVYIVTSFANNGGKTPNNTQPSGAIMKKGATKDDVSKDMNTQIQQMDAEKPDDSKVSGPKMNTSKEYKVGDVIPYKEFMRRNVDLRHGNRKSELTRLANDMFKNGQLNNDVEEPQEESPTLGQIAGWKDNGTITAKDQVNDRFKGLQQQLDNNPQKIDLSQFDKYDKKNR